MSEVDTIRFNRLWPEMETEGLDLLICRLPENVVYLAGTWPVHGVTFAVAAPGQKTVLYIPEGENDLADADWAEVHPFGWGLLEDPPLDESYAALLAEVNKRFLKDGRGRIGVELGFEVVAPSYRSAEPIVPAQPWQNLLRQSFPNAELIDAFPLLTRLRAIKSEFELKKMKIASQIAEMGMNEFLATLRPGLTEAAVGSAIEAVIRRDGPGYRGARMVRASAEVCSGEKNTLRDWILVPSSSRKIAAGDLVMVELGTVVDGYWSDLTYMAVAGEPTARQRRIHNTLLEAQQAAIRMVCDGNAWSDPDQAAREYLAAANLDKFFIHGSGHGIGLRYHEDIPQLGPHNDSLLRVGMVTSVEPGVYIPGMGGIRIEDNVAVTESGPLSLSTPRKPW
jgi:Xaa-Pro dipeptidase